MRTTPSIPPFDEVVRTYFSVIFPNGERRAPSEIEQKIITGLGNGTLPKKYSVVKIDWIDTELSPTVKRFYDELRKKPYHVFMDDEILNTSVVKTEPDMILKVDASVTSLTGGRPEISTELFQKLQKLFNQEGLSISAEITYLDPKDFLHELDCQCPNRTYVRNHRRKLIDPENG